MENPIPLNLDVVLLLNHAFSDAVGKHLPVRAEKPELVNGKPVRFPGVDEEIELDIPSVHGRPCQRKELLIGECCVGNILGNCPAPKSDMSDIGTAFPCCKLRKADAPSINNEVVVVNAVNDFSAPQNTDMELSLTRTDFV